MSLVSPPGPQSYDAPPTAVIEMPVFRPEEEPRDEAEAARRAELDQYRDFEETVRGGFDLGRAAIRSAMAADLSRKNFEYFRHRGEHEFAHDAITQYRQQQHKVRLMLAEARASIAAVTSRELAEEYLRPMLGDTFARVQARRAQRGQPPSHESLLDWLADGEHGATNSQLMGFLQDHLDYLQERRQNPEFVQSVNEAKQTYIEGMQQGVSAGWIDPYAIKTLQKLEHTTFVAGDEWNRYISGCIGQAFISQNAFIVSVDQPPHSDGLLQTVVHELEHVRNPDIQEYPVWEFEAFAEHFTQAIVHGQWEVFNPHVRSDDSGVYTGYRLLQHAILTYGDQAIPTKLATQAHSGGRGGHSQQVYRAAIMQAWGFDVRLWATDTWRAEVDRLRAAGYPLEGEDSAQQVAARTIAHDLRRYHAARTATSNVTRRRHK